MKDDEAIEAAARLLHGAEYTGLVTLEFRRDPKNRKLTVIRADLRVTRPTSLSTALGMDTPTALYGQAVGGSVNAPLAYQEGVMWLSETTLFEALWHNRDTRPLGMEVRRLWQRRGRIKAFAYFCLRDPLPFLAHAQWRGRAWLWSRIHGVDAPLCEGDSVATVACRSARRLILVFSTPLPAHVSNHVAGRTRICSSSRDLAA